MLKLRELYYITHIDNLGSILDKGIFCHKRIIEEKIKFTPIYDAKIVENRKNIKTPDNRSLWDFTNLYFQPRNAMLYLVAFFSGKNIDDIIDDIESDIGKIFDIENPKIESVRDYKDGKKIIKIGSRDGDMTVVLQKDGTLEGPDGILKDPQGRAFVYDSEQKPQQQEPKQEPKSTINDLPDKQEPYDPFHHSLSSL